MSHQISHCPKDIIALLARVSFGFSLLGVGLVHYMTFTSFRGMVSEDLGYGPIEFLGTLWAYLLPALMIVGGALLVLGMFQEVAAWCSGLAVGSIPAGMLLKSVLSGMPLSATMPSVIQAFTWLLILILIIKMQTRCCSQGDCSPVKQ